MSRAAKIRTEFCPPALSIEMRRRLGASLYAVASEENARRQRELRQRVFGMAVMQGFIISDALPDYPLVLTHDYGCEVTA